MSHSPLDVFGLSLALAAFSQAPKWYIGLSGGIDSLVLCHALASLKKHHAIPPITAIHINHQLQPLASTFESHCQQFCNQLNIDLIVKKVSVDNLGNIEANARAARFGAFEATMEPDSVLILAHHAMDQAETFFYRLCRGAGIVGLKSMASVRDFNGYKLIRPLLNISKTTLIDYANAHHIIAIEDPTNRDLHFDRNYLRHKVLPLLYSRWPHLESKIKLTIGHLAESETLLGDLAKIDLASLSCGDDGEPWIEITSLIKLPVARQKNVLRYWLKQLDVILSNQQWEQLLQSVLAAKQDAIPELTIGEKILRRFDQRLYVCQQNPAKIQTVCEWCTDNEVEFNGFCLSLNGAMSMSLTLISRPFKDKAGLSISSKSLKKRFQQLKIKTWQRDAIPLVVLNGQCIAIGQHIICRKFKQQFPQAEFKVVKF